MALKMVHLIVHRMEEGLQCGIHHTHNARDEELELARDYWHNELGFNDEPPSYVFDVLVPADATDDQVVARIHRALDKALMMNQLRSIVQLLIAPR